MTPDIHGLNLVGLQKGFRNDEEIKLVLKRHWIVFFYTGLYAAFLVISSIVLFAYKDSIFALVPSDLFSVLMILYWSMYLLFLYINWVNNELDLFIITDQRIRGVEQVSFLNRTISECALEDVKEVNAQTKGLLENIFNFGTITMHTASEQSHFEMDFASSPIDNASIIRNVIQEHKPKSQQQPTQI